MSGYESLAERTHSYCLMCGQDNPIGFHLDFKKNPQGLMKTRVSIPKTFQGYNGVVHGGILASLLDATMTRCLLDSDILAMTGDFKVRYKHPVPVQREVEVRAAMVHKRKPLYEMKAELLLDGKVMAQATARFMDSPDVISFE